MAVPPRNRVLERTLAQRIAAAVLPGDAPFEPAALEAASAFILSAAAIRKDSGRSIAIESVPGSAHERMTRIAAINDDQPFLVDSIAAAIGAAGIEIARLVHAVAPVRRDDDGRLLGFADRAEGCHAESIVYIETGRVDARARRALKRELTATLTDVHAAVRDWPAMRKAMADDAQLLAPGEGAELLHWLEGNMLTLLGRMVRASDGSESEGLGLCRKGSPPILGEPSWRATFAWLRNAGPGAGPLIIKSNRASTVHRRVPLDLFIVPHWQGRKLVALSLHAGIWTSAALAAGPDEVPVIRAHLSAMLQRSGFNLNGHNGKALVHALTALPRDILISFSDHDIERVALTMMSLVERPRPRLLLVTAPLRRHIFAFVWLPRDAVSTAARRQIEAMVTKAADGPVLDWALEVDGSALALLRFVIDIREGAKVPDEAALDARLQAMLRGWSEAVEAELAGSEAPQRAAALAARYAEAFPLAYRMGAGPTEAAIDIARLHRLGTGETVRRGVRLYCRESDGTGRLRLKLYQRGGAIALSDVVPSLENFGFRVIEDVPTPLDPRGEGHLAIHDFVLETSSHYACIEVLGLAGMIEAAIANVLNGSGENDAFNRLIAAQGLEARAANWLRAWYRYLRQAGMAYSVPTVVDALQGAPQVTNALISLFRAGHDPAFAGDRAAATDKAQEDIRQGLALVSAINDDRLLRAFQALVMAMLRTNAFTPEADRGGAVALAFKLDSAQVPGLPRPVPWREIFVYSPRVEGIHLRAGPVARGGLRWSDRRDDFRTEVLGLMKAQRVKNAVIVPTGAKGGFYPKMLPNPAQDRDGWLTEGREAYRIFVRSLLSLTDNIVDGKVVHPRGVVVRDGPERLGDPYFVVAADKGTASFSDTANAIAAESDFWLDDAFASGGSKGYDHKAIGITARGAWLSVQRHFREMGIDVQADPVRVAGCGDMSGDVFGNGMLLSHAIRLVAAFDHRHVFLDPDPDPAQAWAERVRLFALPRSSWDDYDKALISKGGGVWPRSIKSIPLSKAAQDVLGVEADALDPESLISAILKAPVDLLWFGGIGTYVKARSESNGTVGDPANDALRVDGADVRARVIGEGANLGCTQAGRIEFALAGGGGIGGRINTDFIDNSAGVDCSDKEVNIKIALASAKRAGRLSEPARVKLLTAMTGDVAALVLEDNRLQALALSIAQSGGTAGTGSSLRLIEMLEERRQLDRKTEGLADADVLKRRAADGQGLTRPELAVLLSSAKLALQEALEHSALVDDPGLEGDLLAAFPAAMRGKFRQDIAAHRLRREILATRIANRMVNRIGMIHPFELVEVEGAGLDAVATAFIVAERLFDLEPLWQRIEGKAMSEASRMLLLRAMSSAVRGHMADLLRDGAGTRPASQTVAELAAGHRRLTSEVTSPPSGTAQAQSAQILSVLTAADVPQELAESVVRLFMLDGAIGLARLSRDSGVAPEVLALAYGELGARLRLDWAQQAAAAARPSDPWERLLVAGLARDFQQMRLDFLRRAIGGKSGERRRTDPLRAVRHWTGQHDDAIRQFRALIARAQGTVPAAPAMLAQIAGQARVLLGR